MDNQRIVRLTIIKGSDAKTYEGISISAKGTKFSSPNQGQCDITIIGINTETRENLTRIASPFNKSGERISVILDVGREKDGVSTLYTGDIFRVSETPKPNLGLNLRCITGQFDKSKLVSKSSEEITTLSEIAGNIALSNDLTLSFEIADKNISNYSFTGSANQEIKKLAELSEADVFIDNKILRIKYTSVPKKGSTVKILSKKTGMIETPEGTENGIKVSMLYDPSVQVGSQIEVESEINPVLNGDYVIYKLEFDITNMDKAFYLHAEANVII